MTDRLSDSRVRVAAFDWLATQTAMHGDVLPWSLLLGGFTVDGRRVPLVSQQGIFKPAVLKEVPLSIRTSPRGPYDDSFADGDVLRYRYRGDDPQHRENAGLRSAMARSLPLVYLYGVVPGRYLAVWPVYVVGDHPDSLVFDVAVDDVGAASRLLEYPQPPAVASAEADARRRYITTSTQRRLHQTAFRQKVLQAYREQCALCRLRHSELLDAAHIIRDADDWGDPVVENGLALCKLHHAAFDRHFLGIRPDYVVEVRADVLDEMDGPMLRHGLQGVHGARILLPRTTSLRPDPERLLVRYEEYQRAS